MPTPGTDGADEEDGDGMVLLLGEVADEIWWLGGLNMLCDPPVCPVACEEDESEDPLDMVLVALRLPPLFPVDPPPILGLFGGGPRPLLR